MGPVQSPHSSPDACGLRQRTVFGKYMKSQILIAVVALACATALVPLAGERFVQETSTVPDRAALLKMTARFAPVDIAADATKLNDGDRKALARLVEVAHIIDALFLRQVWAGNDAMLQELAQKAAVPVGPRASRTAAARLRYFLINKGPWDRLDHNKSFVPGAPVKPESANFYPAGAEKADVQKWLDSLSGGPKEAATGFFTTIRRGDKGLIAVPYSVEYQGELSRAAALLREAAQLTSDATLKKFLTTRADAFLSNDYYASDVAWMDLDASIDVTIGPAR